MSTPRVTQILAAAGLGPDYSMVAPDVLGHAAQRGVALHQAIAWHAAGTLDETSLHPEIRPGFEAYLRFLDDMRHEPLVSEIEVVHPLWQYAGHPDRVGFVNSTERVLLDWKYVAHLDVHATQRQVQAYRLGWNALHPTEPVSRCLAIQFFPDGGYRLHDLTTPNVEQVFLAALVVYREREKEGRL